MRRFLVIFSVAYAAIVIACSIYVYSDDGGMFSGPSIMGAVLAQPWLSIIYSFIGNQMSYPEKINSAIDDDQMSKIGMAAEAL
jgi:hypothetical protein